MEFCVAQPELEPDSCRQLVQLLQEQPHPRPRLLSPQDGEGAAQGFAIVHSTKWEKRQHLRRVLCLGLFSAGLDANVRRAVPERLPQDLLPSQPNGCQHGIPNPNPPITMEPEKINHPYLTAIKRTDFSVPTRYLMQHNLLRGKILDFGCGYGFDTDELKKQGYDITGYDYYYRPDFPEGKFDTIFCNYVLNVLEPYAQAEVLMNVTNLLSPKGTAYFAVRRDLTEEGFRLHAIHKQYTYQCNVKLPYKSLVANKSYELYQYNHFNQLPRKEGEKCPFCKLSRRVEIICETATCVAFYDGYPVSQGHALIIPKRHVASYFDLTNHEREAMNVVLQYVKQKVDERYHPDGYNVGINVGEHAGQSVFHCHMHLIPRYKGDVPNPKGGVRGVIPNKQKY